jgi:hypothetical protein
LIGDDFAVKTYYQFIFALIQEGCGEKSQKMTKASQKKVVSRKGLILLGIVGIIGLILLVFGVFSIFKISTLLGLISLVLGLFIYFIFILIERKLKLL